MDASPAGDEILEALRRIGRGHRERIEGDPIVFHDDLDSPGVASDRELHAVGRAVETETGTRLDYQNGTMIELPRAALQAAEIAADEGGAEFFSFGTNDLTQTCLGLSRDDAAPILANYAERGIFPVDPCVSIDLEGVGELVRIGTERGRRVRRDLKVGICGEHGGDPASVAFCHEAGLDYVSCSAFRVPAARLAAAQAAIRARRPGDVVSTA